MFMRESFYMFWMKGRSVPSLWSKLKYLNNCLFICREIYTDVFVPRRINPADVRDWHHEVDICGFK